MSMNIVHLFNGKELQVPSCQWSHKPWFWFHLICLIHICLLAYFLDTIFSSVASKPHHPCSINLFLYLSNSTPLSKWVPLFCSAQVQSFPHLYSPQPLYSKSLHLIVGALKTPAFPGLNVLYNSSCEVQWRINENFKWPYKTLNHSVNTGLK